MKRIVILTGAGISAESGIKTFRDADGLWEGHDVMEVASPEGWRSNQNLVQKFYNDRRKQLFEVSPNEAHKALVKLEEKYLVHVITQNVDDLHERGGSHHVVHLHGELKKARSTVDETYIVDWEDEITSADKCPKGHQLRPHIVWFGEAVPMIETAVELISQCDFVWIIGTSMQVYPAASLVGFAPSKAKIYYIDPAPQINYELSTLDVHIIQDSAVNAVPTLVDEFMTYKN